MCWIHFSVSVFCVGAGSIIPAETCIIGAGVGRSGLREWVGAGATPGVAIARGEDVVLSSPCVDCGFFPHVVLLPHGVLPLSFGIVFWVPKGG